LYLDKKKINKNYNLTTKICGLSVSIFLLGFNYSPENLRTGLPDQAPFLLQGPAYPADIRIFSAGVLQ